jgi:hypothetical protein
MGVDNFFKPDFIIKNLEGWYITPEIADKLYQCNISIYITLR